MDKDACQKWFQSQRTLFGKVTHMRSDQGEPQLTERQKWTRDNFNFLRDHIVHHLKANRPAGSTFSPPTNPPSVDSMYFSNIPNTSQDVRFGAMKSGFPRGLFPKLTQQRTHNPDGRLCTRSHSRILLAQNPLMTQQTCPTWIHIHSVTSSIADSNLQSALAESQRRITELRDMVVKKLSDDKPDDPRLGFFDFLKVEVLQLTSDSNDEFQQETFNLVRLNRRTSSSKGSNMHQAPVWPRPPRTARPRLHTSILCHTPRGRHHSSRSKTHLHTYHKQFHKNNCLSISKSKS